MFVILGQTLSCKLEQLSNKIVQGLFEPKIPLFGRGSRVPRRVTTKKWSPSHVEYSLSPSLTPSCLLCPNHACFSHHSAGHEILFFHVIHTWHFFFSSLSPSDRSLFWFKNHDARVFASLGWKLEISVGSTRTSDNFCLLGSDWDIFCHFYLEEATCWNSRNKNSLFYFIKVDKWWNYAPQGREEICYHLTLPYL
jgi:hypothetical protein